MFPIEFGVKRSNALDIEVKILFQDSKVTPYHTYGLPMGYCYQTLSLPTQERGNLYQLTPFESLGYARVSW
jgi:hypothetical protein